MNKELATFIKKCRVDANLTLEKASELLDIAPRTLSYYERAQHSLPDVIASRMAKIYNEPAIKHYWLKNTKCGADLPNINNKSLVTNILSLAVNMKCSSECLHKLMQIGLDGEITQKEKPEYTHILDTFRLLIEDITLLKYNKN